MALTLLIVDDHPGFRDFARSLLTTEGFEVAGEAGDGESALLAVDDLHPDVVLLDVQLPGIDGFEVARRLAASGNGPRVILTSSREAADFGTRLVDSAADGFLAKQELSGAALSALVAAA
jgi:two-component system, NarL family, nitrate/nitrite response regulator NarL